MIAYGSHILSHPERRYCVTQRELLAAVTFILQFQPYLLGHVFQLHTDHGSHTWLTNFKEPEGQLALWLERLQEFTLQTIHHPTPMLMPSPADHALSAVERNPSFLTNVQLMKQMVPLWHSWMSTLLSTYVSPS